MVEELGENDPSRIGPYELVGILGSGGMGRVYLARDAAGERVAVKVIHADLAREPEFRRRFRREIEALRAVSGPGAGGIAAILNADAEAQRPWLATEYVEGPSLHHAVTAGSGPLDVTAVRSLGAALARTLADIHAAKLVHRDIKPTNLLLPESGPKLIDFGIARDLAASTITRTGLTVGTPQFMAPEQLEAGNATGTAADVFALAGLLVFAASGLGPFGEGTPAQLLYAVVHSEPQLGGVPAELRPLLSRCLRKDPAKRPTAERVAEELSRPPVAEDPDATVPIEGGVGGNAGGVGGAGGGRRGKRAALVGAAALVAVVATAVVLMEGNADGSANAGHSQKGGAFPAGITGTSTSDPTAALGGGTSSNSGGPGGSTPNPGASHSAPVSGAGLLSGPPAGGTTGGPSGGATGGDSGGGPGTGPSTTSQPPVTQGSTPVSQPSKSATTSHAPPPTHAPSSSPQKGSAPAAVTGVAMRPNSHDGSTMAVSWNSDSGATSYVVKSWEEWVPGSSPSSVTVKGTSTSITVIPYQGYCVQVQAVNSYGASAWSPASPLCVQATPET